MKSELTDSILTGVLGAMLILCVIFCLRLGFTTHETRRFMSRVQTMRAEQVRMQGLLIECQNYSSSNPAIEPILQSVGVASLRSLTNAVKAATK